MYMSMITLELCIIMAFCIAGASWTSWKSGQRNGIVATLDHLEKAGVIEFEEG